MRGAYFSSLLGSLIDIIASARPAQTMAEPENEAEWRKSLTAVALEARPVIFIDNLSRPLASGQLARFVTSEVISDRILGRSEMTNLPQDALVVVTGNNVAVGDDMGRRCVLVGLDPQSSRPWLGRSYRHPELLEWALEQRSAIAAAAFTLVQGWIAAGRPAAETPTIGSFGTWCRILGAILAFAGIEGFLSNLDTIYEEVDTDAEQWEALLGAIVALQGDEPFTAAWLAGAIEYNGALVEVAPEALLAIQYGPLGGTTVRLSKLLRQQAGRRYGERALRFARVGRDGHSRLTMWRVEEGG